MNITLNSILLATDGSPEWRRAARGARWQELVCLREASDHAEGILPLLRTRGRGAAG